MEIMSCGGRMEVDADGQYFVGLSEQPQEIFLWEVGEGSGEASLTFRTQSGRAVIYLPTHVAQAMADAFNKAMAEEQEEDVA
jgi:hypothetical protein